VRKKTPRGNAEASQRGLGFPLSRPLGREFTCDAKKVSGHRMEAQPTGRRTCLSSVTDMPQASAASWGVIPYLSHVRMRETCDCGIARRFSAFGVSATLITSRRAGSDAAKIRGLCAPFAVTP
jgi:hypothetical protein